MHFSLVTGTPHLKDKQVDWVFGSYIGNPYKFDEAVESVVLDLLYEARDVEQFVTDQQSIDEWFDAETKGLTHVAKVELKKRWGTSKKYCSRSRLEKLYLILSRILKKPRLSTGRECNVGIFKHVSYELFKQWIQRCAIITSYEPHHGV